MDLLLARARSAWSKVIDFALATMRAAPASVLTACAYVKRVWRHAQGIWDAAYTSTQ